jgi:hypothetical protein
MIISIQSNIMMSEVIQDILDNPIPSVLTVIQKHHNCEQQYYNLSFSFTNNVLLL